MGVAGTSVGAGEVAVAGGGGGAGIFASKGRLEGTSSTRYAKIQTPSSNFSHSLSADRDTGAISVPSFQETYQFISHPRTASEVSLHVGFSLGLWLEYRWEPQSEFPWLLARVEVELV